jgi:hypothetical protein
VSISPIAVPPTGQPLVAVENGSGGHRFSRDRSRDDASPYPIQAHCPEVNRIPYYRQCRRTCGEPFARFAAEATRGAQLFRLVKQHETAPSSRGSADRNRKFALSIIRILFRLPAPNEPGAEVLRARFEEGRARLSRKPASRARADESDGILQIIVNVFSVPDV